MTSSALSSSPSVVASAAVGHAAPRRRAYFVEAKYELIKQLRIPAFLVPTLGFPIMFYVLFGLVLPSGRAGTVVRSTYMLATYGAFGVIGIALFALGVGVAVERGQGWLSVKRASPMPIPAYLVAKYTTTLAISGVLILSMCGIGALFGGVHLSAARWAALVAAEAFGAVPFCAMGLAIGYLAGPNSASPTVNLLYLPMSFLSGLFIPVEMLPKVLQRFAVVLPPYHLGRLALDAVGAEPASHAWVHVLALLGFGVFFSIVAVIAYRRDEGRTYG